MHDLRFAVLALTVALAACSAPGRDTTLVEPTDPDFRLTASSPTSIAAPLDLADVFERVAPAVVTVRTLTEIPGAIPSVFGVRRASAGVGSGVLVAESGHILTASHVVHTADQVEVEFLRGERIEARVIATDPSADLACVELVSAPPAYVRPVELAGLSTVRVGEPAFVVGAPLGITHTLTVGHVSALRRGAPGLEGLRPLGLIQTDAAISPGNSGGPLFDLDGHV
ncbi:MAG: trypsin-like peptidase domain-containing protein, partial [Planctomycetota bacterium]